MRKHLRKLQYQSLLDFLLLIQSQIRKCIMKKDPHHRLKALYRNCKCTNLQHLNLKHKLFMNFSHWFQLFNFRNCLSFSTKHSLTNNLTFLNFHKNTKRLALNLAHLNSLNKNRTRYLCCNNLSLNLCLLCSEERNYTLCSPLRDIFNIKRELRCLFDIFW